MEVDLGQCWQLRCVLRWRRGDVPRLEKQAWEMGHPKPAGWWHQSMMRPPLCVSIQPLLLHKPKLPKMSWAAPLPPSSRLDCLLGALMDRSCEEPNRSRRAMQIWSPLVPRHATRHHESMHPAAHLSFPTRQAATGAWLGPLLPDSSLYANRCLQTAACMEAAARLGGCSGFFCSWIILSVERPLTSCQTCQTCALWAGPCWAPGEPSLDGI